MVSRLVSPSFASESPLATGCVPSVWPSCTAALVLLLLLCTRARRRRHYLLHHPSCAPESKIGVLPIFKETIKRRGWPCRCSPRGPLRFIPNVVRVCASSLIMQGRGHQRDNRMVQEHVSGPLARLVSHLISPSPLTLRQWSASISQSSLSASTAFLPAIHPK